MNDGEVGSYWICCSKSVECRAQCEFETFFFSNAKWGSLPSNSKIIFFWNYNTYEVQSEIVIHSLFLSCVRWRHSSKILFEFSFSMESYLLQNESNSRISKLIAKNSLSSTHSTLFFKFFFRFLRVFLSISFEERETTQVYVVSTYQYFTFVYNVRYDGN